MSKAIQHVPDVIISDVMMPIKDGYSLLDELKHNDITSHIPIILLTAKSADDSRIKGLRKGADAYMTKPFNTEELEVRVEKLIEIRRTLQEKYQKSRSTKVDGLKDADHSEEQVNFLKLLTKKIYFGIESQEFSVSVLAEEMYMSRSQLFRKIKATTGLSPTEVVRNVRLDRAYDIIKEKKGNIAEISSRVGFADRKYFSQRFKDRFGLLPSKVKQSEI